MTWVMDDNTTDLDNEERKTEVISQDSAERVDNSDTNIQKKEGTPEDISNQNEDINSTEEGIWKK